MNLSAILSVTVSTIGQIENVVQLDWLGKIIKSLIEGCGSIGVGIIVFTLILKLITLPFDVFSRVSTKKNAIKMEKMRPELEKLQRQYANNNELYQKKMQSLYKENGYSPFATCLPTLLNLIFFIVVIGQFSTYSNYANFNVFCKMSTAYVSAVDNYNTATGTEYIIKGEDGNNYIDLVYLHENSDYLKAFGFNVTQNNRYDAEFSLEYNTENVKKLYNAIANDGYLAAKYQTGENGHILENGTYNAELIGETYKDNPQAFTNLICDDLVGEYAEKFNTENIKAVARAAAAQEFRNNDLSFLWVKNIWCQDLPWEHPVKSDFSKYNFVKSSGCAASCQASCGGVNNRIENVTEEQYKELTADLQEEKTQPNGYLILVILSIGTMLLSQIVMTKTNKTQMELSSVDGENGSAAMSQKMMTWMMPIMFGFFSFMYTASFSIYMVVSSLFGLLSHLLINFIVDKKYEKVVKEEMRNEELRRTGRIKEIKNDDKKKNKRG